MAVRPVRFISDVLTRKQILKTDSNDNILFRVSGSLLGGGVVSSSFPVTASGLYINGDTQIDGTLTAKRMHITEITSSVYYETSISASINALNDVSAANAISGNALIWDGNNWIASNNISGNIFGSFNGNLNGTASYANSSSYAIQAGTALTALYAVNAGNLIGSGTTNYIPVFTSDKEISDSTLSLSGSTLIAGADLVISGALHFNNNKNFSNIDSSLNSPSNFYTVSDVLSFVNDRIGDIRTNYSKLSETIVDNFNSDGTKTVQLNNFFANDIDNIYLDVMVKYSGSSAYINDLISVELYANIALNKLFVDLTALSLSEQNSFRLIATKQTGSLF